MQSVGLKDKQSEINKRKSTTFFIQVFPINLMVLISRVLNKSHSILQDIIVLGMTAHRFRSELAHLLIAIVNPAAVIYSTIKHWCREKVLLQLSVFR